MSLTMTPGRRPARFAALALALALAAGPGSFLSAAEDAKPPEWPAAAGAVFALRNTHFSTPRVTLDDQGRELMAFNCTPRGRALIGRFWDLVCDGGSFLARDAGTWVGMQVAKSGAFSIELTLTPADASPKGKAVVFAYADASGEDLALLQDADGLALRIKGKETIALFAPHVGQAVHLLVACGNGTWTAWRDGKQAGSGPLPAGSADWGRRQLVMGSDARGDHPWLGRLEGVAVFPRALSDKQAAAQAAALRALQADRKPATRVRFEGTLLRQAKTADLSAIQPYTRSLTVAEYKVDKVLAGQWKQPTIQVLHWMIMDSKRLPLADRKAGAKVTLSVEPVDQHPELESCRRDDDLGGDICLDLFYCESECEIWDFKPRAQR